MISIQMALMVLVLGVGVQPMDLALASRTITVTGTAKIDMPAEYAKINFKLQVDDKLENSQGKFAKLESKVISIGKAFGLQANDFQFNHMYIDLKRGTLLTSDKVRQTKSGSVKIKRISAVPSLVAALLKVGVIVSPHIVYEVSDMSKIKMIAFEKALESAKLKADLVASRLGEKGVKRLLRFKEYSNSGYMPVPQSNTIYRASNLPSGRITMSGPRVIYKLTVTVIYQLQ